jgi:hypothetical protein
MEFVNSRETLDSDYQHHAPSDETPSTCELLAYRPLGTVLIAGTALAFITSAYNALFVLLAYSPLEHGGFGFSVSKPLGAPILPAY